MPANLSPEYKRADEVYRQAKTVEEKLAALEEMLACIPKHKGTEHMQADLKRRIAKLKEAPASKAGARTRDIFHVERGGAGQAVLIGAPNCGKSAIVGALTKAKVAVTDYPFGTHTPVPGMAFHEDVPIQLVDMPPVTPEAVPPGMMGAYRAADIVVVVVDLAAADALEQLDACLNVLTSRNLVLVGRRVGRDERDEEGRQPKTALILGTKADLPGAADTLDALRELYGDRLPMFAVSATTRQGLDAFVAHLFATLDVIRVYCKQPGKPPDMGAPFILPRGSTVLDMAREVHRDFPDKLKYACVWGSAKFDGQQVHRDHVLQDRDIVELHVPS
ncbi:MAG: TGS domain-containing protein [Planctomycetes bacterium]|nr:TGS domain-containing protein [Planctomycetota bacterium]